jgi:hypothetical protein
MKRLISKIRSIKGVSLMEILIAMLMTGIVTAAIFKVYINQHKNWIIQDEITNMQQNGRAGIDELTRQIRMAGANLPTALEGIEAYDTNPDTIVLNYSADNCNVRIEKKMPQPSSELDCVGHDVSCFWTGQFAFILDPATGFGEFFEISFVQLIPGKIQHNKWPLSQTYDTNAVVLSLERVKYYIDNSDTLHPNLMVELPGQGPQIYAENIEDLQFRYRLKNGAIVDVPTITTDVREVLFSLTAKTEKADPDFPSDPYRRRSYSSRVNLRNLGS